MIPKFPQSKKIELSDRLEVEKITKRFPPYSDFNFTSMWSWDIKGEMEISELNQNLVVKFTDYITGIPFYSFLGKNNVNDTTHKLLECCRDANLECKLKLVPEDSVRLLDREKFLIEEDRDNFDYILSLEYLSKYDSPHLKNHASHQRHFSEAYIDHSRTKVLNLDAKEIREEILSLTKKWAQNKISQQKDLLPHLEDAVARYFLQNSYNDNVIAVGIFYKEKLIAFNINELVDNDFCTCHFMKADNTFKGIYSHLVYESSKILLEIGKKYINFEQDLGLKNLRQSKKSYHPVDFLKKYTVVVK